MQDLNAACRMAKGTLKSSPDVMTARIFLREKVAAEVGSTKYGARGRCKEVHEWELSCVL
jgi:hypothetical protein